MELDTAYIHTNRMAGRYAIEGNLTAEG